MPRPELLTHWTGKDLDQEHFEDIAQRRHKYVERLRGTLEGGLWMMPPQEELRGRGAAHLRYKVPMTCFTELRLSAAKPHAKAYGHLGFVVDREFVLEREGGPVRYVPAENSLSVGRLWDMKTNLQSLEALVDFLDGKEKAYFDRLKVNLLWQASFIKSMGPPEDPYRYLAEEEWRIVEDRTIEGVVSTGQASPPAKVPLGAEDLRMLIVLDEETRGLIHGDKWVAEWFKGRLPPILTLDEASHF